jgi:hypothetical protein
VWCCREVTPRYFAVPNFLLNALCKWAFNDTANAVCNSGGSGGLSLTSVGGFLADYYWSSSEGGVVYAWFQYFGSGFQYNYYKQYTYYVRPVRAF